MMSALRITAAAALVVHAAAQIPDLSVRLVDERLPLGAIPSAGRVEVRYNRAWHSIAPAFWSVGEATVICRQLGYSAAIKNPSHDAKTVNLDADFRESYDPVTMSEQPMKITSYTYEGAFADHGPGEYHSGDKEVRAFPPPPRPVHCGQRPADPAARRPVLAGDLLLGANVPMALSQ